MRAVVVPGARPWRFLDTILREGEAVAVSRRYWWVNQTTNFDSEIGRGRLWASTNRYGTLIKGRRSILEMAPGDLAFHYNRAAVRAVSEVVKAAARTQRPAAYPKVDPRDPDRGWTVRVATVSRSIRIPSDQVSETLPKGTVLDKNGQVNRRYIFELTEAEAESLVGIAGLEVPSQESVFGRPRDELISKADPTDAYAWAKARLEQAALREHLLSEHSAPRCALCGHELPPRLLVAAHIKPRRDCTDEERRDFDNIAMLVCTLGCDVLFEWGYVIVDQRGRIRPGQQAEEVAVRDAVERLKGRQCLRFNTGTATHFAARTRVLS